MFPTIVWADGTVQCRSSGSLTHCDTTSAAQHPPRQHIRPLGLTRSITESRAQGSRVRSLPTNRTCDHSGHPQFPVDTSPHDTRWTTRGILTRHINHLYPATISRARPRNESGRVPRPFQQPARGSTRTRLTSKIELLCRRAIPGSRRLPMKAPGDNRDAPSDSTRHRPGRSPHRNRGVAAEPVVQQRIRTACPTAPDSAATTRPRQTESPCPQRD
ncbi:MAG: hypothetical protein JWN03_2805 [Nocardia sp.]|nr:hypothetical protein [Nocardia sp.]